MNLNAHAQRRRLRAVNPIGNTMMSKLELSFWALPATLMIFAMLASPARATDWDWDIHGTKAEPRKKVHRAKRRPQVRYYAAPRHEEDRTERFCLGPVRGVGSQWIGTEGALNAAKKDWMERVRYDLGESFLDLSHAVSIEQRCGRTSIGETLGQILYRCEVIARPCKAEFSEGVAGK